MSRSRTKPNGLIFLGHCPIKKIRVGIWLKSDQLLIAADNSLLDRHKGETE